MHLGNPHNPIAHDLEERFGTLASSPIRGSDKRATNWTGTNPRNSSRPRKTQSSPELGDQYD
jgi:hypothetical protein